MVLQAAELCDLDYPTPVWRALPKRKVGTITIDDPTLPSRQLDVNKSGTTGFREGTTYVCTSDSHGSSGSSSYPFGHCIIHNSS